MKNKITHKPEDYKCIKRWGEMLGSFTNYIENEQRKASESNAPLTAIFDLETNIYGRSDEWSVAENIVDKNLRKHILNA